MGANEYLGTPILEELFSSHLVSKIDVLLRAEDIDTEKLSGTLFLLFNTLEIA